MWGFSASKCYLDLSYTLIEKNTRRIFRRLLRFLALRSYNTEVIEFQHVVPASSLSFLAELQYSIQKDIWPHFKDFKSETSFHCRQIFVQQLFITLSGGKEKKKGITLLFPIHLPLVPTK